MSVYLLYIVDKSITGKDLFPDLSFTDFKQFPLLYLGTSLSKNLKSVLYDCNSLYNKFKKSERYYTPFMELYKYHDNVYNNCHLSIRIHPLTDHLINYLFKYRLFYGDRLILDTKSKDLLIKLCSIIDIPLSMSEI